MNENKLEVTVILSTYNGSNFLDEQLQSLVNQKAVNIKVYARDDGSSDDTLRILDAYRDKFEALFVEEGENIGATKSFYEAARHAFQMFDTEYYAFCDQDDIWESNKLLIGINSLKSFSKSEPNLYFSNLMKMDNSNNLLGELLDEKIVAFEKSNALSSINTYGCTCVFNKKALEKFLIIDYDHQYIYHDNWIYAVCVYLGNVVYDHTPHIKYRQTGNNVSGSKDIGLKLWINRMKKLFHLKHGRHIYESIAYELLVKFQYELDEEYKEFLFKICNYRKSIIIKFTLLFSKALKTRSFQKNMCIVGRILINQL